ncbi:RfaG Glycosyltransferase [Candidatus Nanopelagicaceae bacterium]
MKSVFHVITTINRGGAENQLLVLAREQVKLGLDVHIVYLKGEPELQTEFTQIGTNVHHAVARRHPFFQPLALLKLIGKSNPVIHAHLPRAELVSLLTPARFTFVASRHNTEEFFPRAPKYLSNLLSRVVELRSIKIIAISNAVKNYLVNQGEISNPKKIEVVLYGYKPTLDPTRRNLHVSNKLSKFGTVSRLTEQKDIPTLLRAFQNIRRDIPEASLSIVGSGSLETNLRALCSQLTLESAVLFLGRTSKVMNFLAGLDVFILTSTYEGFGMVLLEAMDAGVPIVASRNSAIPEVLGEDFPGLCETGNHEEFSQLILNLKNPDYRNHILKMQELRLALFDAEIMARKISQIYSR